METLVGFAVGFIAGTKEGRAGLSRILEAADAIRTSPEVHKLVEGAISVTFPIVRQLTAAARG